MKKINITEKMEVHKEWYKEAKNDISMEKLPAFLKKLTTQYRHDYGTIVHALTAGAIATMWAMNRTPQGGITGFQASCVMWEFIKNWMQYKGSVRLLRYDDLLYPQNDYNLKRLSQRKFGKTCKKKLLSFLVEEMGVKQLESIGNLFLMV